MKQVVQSAGGGAVEIVEAPAPQLTTTSVLVATEATLISSGTERAVTKLAQSSLLDKARARPDLVKQVISKARTDGLKPTIQAVRSRLADDLALGYSGAGTVLEVGSAVRGIVPGQRVATGGGGFASHAEFQAVPWVLASPLPDNVTAEQASFATVASVGLHGLRQADTRIGSKIVVVGLGLIGQLTARMAVASGCDVLGIDLDQRLLDLAEAHGIQTALETGADTTAHILDWSRGRGADAVVITAGAQGNSGIIRAVPDRCRDRATVVAVGDVGLDLDRNDFYLKELDLKLARSYGPGRYDRSYEDWGVDYPVGHVRWTEGRNLEAVVDLLASGRLEVDDLVTHRFEISAATIAYEVLDDSNESAIGIVLSYRPTRPERTINTTSSGKKARSRRQTVGIVGAGPFVRSMVIPGLRAAGFGPIVHVASASGLSASRLAEREAIPKVSSSAEAVVNDPEVDTVVIATTHSTHAAYTAAALNAGKNVYCEKPVAISLAELEEVERALSISDGRLYVGLNRRWSPMLTAVRNSLAAGSGPISILYRVNAGPVSPAHWYSDPHEGGRLRGEVCHMIDAASSLVDSHATSVYAVSPNSLSHDSFSVLISYADGSSASIVYEANGWVGLPKEYCEVSGRGMTAILDNYRSLTINGREQKVTAGKGHTEGLAAFRGAIESGTEPETRELLSSSRTTLCAARSVSLGRAVSPELLDTVGDDLDVNGSTPVPSTNVE